MKRQAFVGSLIAATAVAEFARIAPARADIDEAGLGREMFIQLREDGEILFDSPFYEHLNEVGSVIATSVRSRYPYPIRFFVIKGDSANAMSVPGGYIYVNEPLLQLAKNRDELAGVLAHETGHMVKHHVAKRIENSKKAGAVSTVGTILASVLLGGLGGAVASNGIDALQAKQDANLSSHIEAEADEEGARIMAATNQFNPYGMVWFFQTMTATYGPGSNSWLRDHPLDSKRIDDLRSLFHSDVATFGHFKDTNQRDVAYW